MKKKEIVIVVLLIVFGFIYNAVQKGKIKFIDDFSGYFNERRLISEQYAEFPQKQMVFLAPQKILIDNPAGEMIINKSADDQVRLSATLRVYYLDKADVEKISRNTRIHAETENNELHISGDYLSAFPYKRLRIRFELQVPEGVVLSVSNHEGNISISQSGKDVYLKQENGNVFLADIPSALQIDIRGGNLDVKNIAGNVIIDAKQSDILLENAAALRLLGRHGNYSLKKIKANVYIEHAFGAISLDGAGQAEIYGRHSKLVVRNIETGVKLSNAFQGIFIENIKGDVQLESRSGKIEINHVNARNIVLENSFADIAIADCVAETLNIVLKNGNLNFQGIKIADRLNVESRQGNIDLVLGNLTDPTFNIKTIRGRIYNHSTIGLDIFQEKDESFANRSGQKPEIIINSNYGDINLK
jgi:hypothetical protein